MSQFEYSVGLARPRTDEEFYALVIEYLKNKALTQEASDDTIDV